MADTSKTAANFTMPRGRRRTEKWGAKNGERRAKRALI